MQLRWTFILFSTLLSWQWVSAQYDLFQADQFNSERLQQIKSSTVAMIEADDVNRPNLSTFNEAYNFCSRQNFVEEKVWTHCSGVLISKDIVLTAGHCLVSPKCSDAVFAFDYKTNNDISRIQAAPELNQYKCKKVLAWTDPVRKKSLVDYALIQLDRPVLDREPIALSKNNLNQPQNILAFGYPYGLPMKASVGYVSSKNAILNSKSKKTFYSAQMLAPLGLSGGGVYDEKNQFVGILVRGGGTVEVDSGGHCDMPKECTSTSCPWMEVQKLPIDMIQKLIENP